MISLILADSVETHPYSNLIFLMICRISWAYLSVALELKWSPSGFHRERHYVSTDTNADVSWLHWLWSHWRRLFDDWASACHSDEGEGTWLQIVVVSCGQHCQWFGRFLSNTLQQFGSRYCSFLPPRLWRQSPEYAWFGRWFHGQCGLERHNHTCKTFPVDKWCPRTIELPMIVTVMFWCWLGPAGDVTALEGLGLRLSGV